LLGGKSPSLAHRCRLQGRIQRADNAQIIMATYLPILMALPDPDLWQMERFGGT
jgi:predicted ATPase